MSNPTPGTPGAWTPPAVPMSEDEQRILDILWEPVPEDVKFRNAQGLTVAPRSIAEDRARRAFGPFGHGLVIKDVQEVRSSQGALQGIRVVATFWANIPGRPSRFETDVVGWYPWDQREGESFAAAYNRVLKAARGDAFKQGLFQLGFGWDLKEAGEGEGNGSASGRPAPGQNGQAKASDAAYTAVITDFTVRRPQSSEPRVYYRYRVGNAGGQQITHVTSCMATLHDPDGTPIGPCELVFYETLGVLEVADNLRIGQTLRIAGDLKGHPGAHRWFAVREADVLDPGSGPTFAEYVAGSQPGVA